MKTFFQLVAIAIAVLVLVVLGLRGVVVLGADADIEHARAHDFVLAAASELERWHAESGEYPRDLNVLSAAAEEREQVGVGELFGGIFRAPVNELPAAIEAVQDGALLDPWGRPWQFDVDDDAARVRLRSTGADRADGGDGAMADLELTCNGRSWTLVHLGQDPLW